MKTGLITAAELCLTGARYLTRLSPGRMMGISVAVLLVLVLGGGGAYAVASAVAKLAPDASRLPVSEIVETVATLPLQAQSDALDAHPQTLFRSDISRASDTADTLLKRLGINDPAAAAFLRTNATIQEVLLGRAGRYLSAEASDANTLIKLSARWSPEKDGTFQRLVIDKNVSSFSVKLETAALTPATRLASGIIHSSLFAAMDDARLPDAMAIQIADVFAGDIDFHHALRKGDRFSVVYETLEGDGEPLRTGRLLSAEFVNGGKTHQALWFQEPAANATASAASAPRGAYYTLGGKSLRRSYLASPLEFSRVSSTFSVRFHPILKQMRAHLGVDYAAPTGTPVRSVGDGVVDFAGVQSGFGNIVIVKHRNNHSTFYAHLSEIAVTRGQAIAQGQTLGAVGSTGRATGPHLHFEFRVNGGHQDPLTIAEQSETIPISPASKTAFTHLADSTRLQLAAASSIRPGSAQ